VSSTLLEVESLSVVRGNELAVEDVSFVVAPGDFVTVVGPNGAGKSTMFAAMLGLLPIAHGRVKYGGTYGYVPQQQPGQLDFPVSALDVVLMGAYRRLRPFRPLPRSVRREAVEALERVSLGERARKRFGALSGGQRQRVLLARALLEGGEILLLDEVLAGVDAASEATILEVLTAERRDGRAVVMATHDLHLARVESTAVLLLHRNQFAFGPPGQALAPEVLRRAYGSRLIVLDDDGTHAIDEGSHHDDHDRAHA
jgi:manganese/iron transport system ATP-binding protein